ncbi:DNA endonuclease SmrA [Pelagibaculum spongiae]|uniref:DNA endonuclease SmrA n=1 Tax=Pelagibaculum spongiae TaxID=2080658 RepID=A0A2V1GPZ5_9GAMM|nr:DNA endonuclease SmrA [Pelagibaculum spongiae]PVZ62965.1 DNA endonuclease SmrA [Pelagibaculum spongiae]
MQDEENLFQSEVGNVKPLAPSRKANIQSKTEITPGHQMRKISAVHENKETNPLGNTGIEMVNPNDFLQFRRPGVQDRVYKKLRQGKFPIDSRLDLHRRSLEQARQDVWEFISDCVQSDLKVVLITHGKGDRGEQQAVIKSHVNHWLPMIDEVLAFHTAQRHHGGAGCMYLLLKKSSSSKQKKRQNYDDN